MKRYHVSKNLFDKNDTTVGWTNGSGVTTADTYGAQYRIDIGNVSEFTAKVCGEPPYSYSFCFYDSNDNFIGREHFGSAYMSEPQTVTVPQNAAYTVYQVACGGSTSDVMTQADLDSYMIMLNTGSQTLPYEPYGNTWQTKSPPKYGTATDTLTSFPATVIPDGTNASADIIGNMNQSGVPSPSSPITPSECGDRTANLFDENATDTTKGYVSGRYLVYTGATTVSSPYCISEYISISPNTSYTLVYGGTNNAPSICFYDSDYNYIIGYKYDTRDVVTETTPIDAAFCRFSYSESNKDVVMFNTGSTALPYEPYGYKIPILSGGVTTPVYLGEVQSTRNIKKIIFDGQDRAVTLNAVDTNRIVVRKTIIAVNGQGYCSHLGNNVSGNNKIVIAANTIFLSFDLQVIGGDTLADVNAYFAQQYANGTPVTVWYVLAEPTTGIVNEPIRKIGDYADSVSVTGIPTVAGSQTFDVDTTLKPSEVALSYHGWHRKEPKERVNGQWE